MEKISAALRLVGIVLFSFLVCSATHAQRPPDNVAGDWIIYSTNAENGSIEVKHVQIVQYGNQITGHFDGPVQSGAIEGEVHGHRIRFSTVTRNVLHFSGDIFGDTITGSYGIHGRRASWEAIRTTASSQDYPTGTILSGMPMLVPTPPPAPVPPPAPTPPPALPPPAPAPAAAQEAAPADTSAQAILHQPQRHRLRSNCKPLLPPSRFIRTRWLPKCLPQPATLSKLRSLIIGSHRTRP
jgi:hypothetical protein